MTIYKIYEPGARRYDVIRERSLTKALEKYLSRHPELKSIDDTIVYEDEDLDGIIRDKHSGAH